MPAFRKRTLASAHMPKPPKVYAADVVPQFAFVQILYAAKRTRLLAVPQIEWKLFQVLLLSIGTWPISLDL